MPGIFISYRRSDSGGHAGRLRDHLSAHFGPSLVFQDVDIGDGDVFADVIDRALLSCDVVLVVIGRDWVGAGGSGGNRLSNADDWVRLEVTTALRREIRVIPVLVEGARLPVKSDLPGDLQPILDRNARELRDISWQADVDLLLKSIEKSVKRPTPVGRYVRAFSTRTLVITASACLSVVFLIVWINSVGVPNVVGMPVEEARRTIRSVNIGVINESRTPSPGRAGVILKQDPTPGRHWRAAGLNLVVSEGESIDLAKFMKVRQQGDEGTGPAFAVATAIDASFSAQGEPVMVSPRYLYAKSRRRDNLPANREGANPKTVLDIAAEFGAPTEQEWPYHAKDRILPTSQGWDALDRLATKHRASVTPVGSLAEIYDYLKRFQPVVAVVLGSDTWVKPEVQKTGRVKIVEAPNPEASHVVAFIGFDPMTATLRFANSWGVEWGDHGFGSMSMDVAEKMVDANQMWAVGSRVQ